MGYENIWLTIVVVLFAVAVTRWLLGPAVPTEPDDD